MDCYAIRDWSKHFEKADNRKTVNMFWVPIPTRHDGKGYRRLIRQKRGPEMFAAWVLMVQIAAKMPVRGVLADQDAPLTPIDMEDKTGCPAEVFEHAIKVLSDPQIGWLQVVHPDDVRMPSGYRPEVEDKEDREERRGKRPETIRTTSGSRPSRQFGLLDQQVRERLKPLVDHSVDLERDVGVLDEWVRDTHNLSAANIEAILACAEAIPGWPSEFRPLRDTWRKAQPKPVEKPIPMRVRTKAVRNDDGTTTIYYSDGTSENHSNTKVST